MRKNKVYKMVVVISFIFICNSYLCAQMSEQTDNTSVITLRGKVIDQTTRNPIPFATIFLANTSIGTVTNNEGEFILKVPESSPSKTVTIAFMGYTTMNYDINDLKGKNNTLTMIPQVINIQEVIVRTNDPTALISAALKNIPENYGKSPSVCTAFYRESIMQNKKYVGVAEAVLDIYKSRYGNDFERDRIKVFKGRKSQDLKRIDTMVFKLQGGHHVAMLLDLAKNPQNFMDATTFDQYNYQPVTLTNIEDRQTYVIEFSPKKYAEEAMYQGKLYIDAVTLAIKKAEFSISPDAFEIADKLLILRKPLNTKVHTADSYYSVDYRNINGRWTLNHVRYQLKFKVDKKHHLFSKMYTSTVDLAITDKDTVNISKFKYSETIKSDEIFMDHLSNHYDEDFWGSYNIIKPEEPIEEAVERIGKRMKRYHPTN